MSRTLGALLQSGASVQGGMGGGVSLAELCGAVARCGHIGVVSGVALDLYLSHRTGQKRLDHEEAARIEISEAVRLSKGNGLVAVNVLYHMHTAEATVKGAIRGGAQAIFAGAGLPTDLPIWVPDPDIALVPIVSSARGLEIICKKWKDRRPSAAVLEGPLAGGHLGFKPEEIEDPAYQLEALLPAVLEVSHRYGGFPIIVAGGIWDRVDIRYWREAGATSVQMGTRFLATKESGASNAFKEAIVAATADDIVVAVQPGSPAGMPFRVIKSSPGYQAALNAAPIHCRWGYMKRKVGDEMICRAVSDPGSSFCICDGLLNATWEKLKGSAGAIFTVGTNGYRVGEIMTVDDLIDELTEGQ